MPTTPTARPEPRPTFDRCRSAVLRPGFSLIELLTVILIISILIAITVPTLSSVQRSGRTASTQSLLTELTNAVASFELDNNRLPGYFSQAELGSTTNFNPGPSAGPGLTAIENAMLDLSGVGAVVTEQPSDPGSWVEVNPLQNNARRIWVKADLIGADEGNYFLPGGSNLVHMTREQQPGTITSGQVAGPGLPDLIDAFGQPVLAWVADESAPTNIREREMFAQATSNSGTSLFYWNANGSMLSSTQLGDRGQDMTRRPTPGGGGSLIGSGAYDVGTESIVKIMGALLGNPGYPDEARLAAGDYEEIFPRQPRGRFVAHSAGPDAVYLAANDKKLGRLVSGDMLGGGNLNITYGVNFFTSTSGNRRSGDNGQPVSADFLDGFDDIVVSQ